MNKKFSVRYYLNLVLIDEENRRYFKQQEITIFRVPEVSATSTCRMKDAHIVAPELMWIVCSIPVFMFFLFHGSYDCRYCLVCEPLHWQRTTMYKSMSAPMR